MATTYIKPYKTVKGSTAIETMKDRIDYGQGEKQGNGALATWRNNKERSDVTSDQLSPKWAGLGC